MPADVHVLRETLKPCAGPEFVSERFKEIHSLRKSGIPKGKGIIFGKGKIKKHGFSPSARTSLSIIRGSPKGPEQEDLREQSG